MGNSILHFFCCFVWKLKIDYNEACLQEDVAPEDTGNLSVFSGVSDRSMILRNSNLWAGDTSKVDLEALRKESMKVRRKRM